MRRVAPGLWFLRLASRSKTPLETSAREFGDRLSRLLNKTICKGIHLSGIIASNGNAIVGRNVTADSPTADPIPLTITKAANAKVFLHLLYTLRYHDRDGHLTTVQSQIQLKIKRSENIENDDDPYMPILTYDYTQQPDNDYPPTHVHIEGNSEGLQGMLAATGVSDKKPEHLHVSVGSTLYRPCLEDVIEFCICEGLVKRYEGWEKVLNKSRSRYYQDQLRSAILTDTDHAAQILRDLGYTVH